MAVPQRLRFEVFRRDEYTCRYCGGRAPDVTLVVDHVVPEALGGRTEASNLVTACSDCNSGKASIAPDSPIVENVADDAVRWAAAMDRAATIRRAELTDVDLICEAVMEAWEVYFRHDPETKDWQASIRAFLDAGLDEEDLVRFIHVVGRRRRQVEYPDRWRYFCGCCWREVEERQAIARRLLEGS